MIQSPIAIGSAVTYTNVNLRDMLGRIVALGPTPRGGNCLVRWNGRQYTSEESLFNLREAAA